MLSCSFSTWVTRSPQEINCLKCAEKFFSKRTQPARREHGHSANQMILSGREYEHLLWITTPYYLNMTHPRCYSTSKGLLMQWPGDRKNYLFNFNCCELNFTVREAIWCLKMLSVEYALHLESFSQTLVHLVYMLHENSSEILSVSVFHVDMVRHHNVPLTTSWLHWLELERVTAMR